MEAHRRGSDGRRCFTAEFKQEQTRLPSISSSKHCTRDLPRLVCGNHVVITRLITDALATRSTDLTLDPSRPLG
jgi:hypothetical protein